MQSRGCQTLGFVHLWKLKGINNRRIEESASCLFLPTVASSVPPAGFCWMVSFYFTLKSQWSLFKQRARNQRDAGRKACHHLDSTVRYFFLCERVQLFVASYLSSPPKPASTRKCTASIGLNMMSFCAWPACSFVCKLQLRQNSYFSGLE